MEACDIKFGMHFNGLQLAVGENSNSETWSGSFRGGSSQQRNTIFPWCEYEWIILSTSFVFKSWIYLLKQMNETSLRCFGEKVLLGNKLITFRKESDLLHNLLPPREIGFASHLLQYFPGNKCFTQFLRAPETVNISLRKARVRKSTCIGFLTFLHLRRKGFFSK